MGIAQKLTEATSRLGKHIAVRQRKGALPYCVEPYQVELPESILAARDADEAEILIGLMHQAMQRQGIKTRRSELRKLGTCDPYARSECADDGSISLWVNGNGWAALSGFPFDQVSARIYHMARAIDERNEAYEKRGLSLAR